MEKIYSHIEVKIKNFNFPKPRTIVDYAGWSDMEKLTFWQDQVGPN